MLDCRLVFCGGLYFSAEGSSKNNFEIIILMFLNFFHYQGLVNLVVKRRGRPLSQIHGFGTDLWDIKRLSLRLKCVHSHFLHLSWDSSLSVCSLILILVQCLSPVHDDLCTSTFIFFVLFSFNLYPMSCLVFICCSPRCGTDFFILKSLFVIVWK